MIAALAAIALGFFVYTALEGKVKTVSEGIIGRIPRVLKKNGDGTGD